MIEPYQTTFAEDMWIHPLAKAFIMVCYCLALFFLFSSQFIAALLFWSAANFATNRMDRVFTRVVRHYLDLPQQEHKSFIRFVKDEETKEED
ncbi:MAG: hypothetical protein H8D23_15960 [Candidatus Brocadiales bacterium]|nr:hypothetical protein [Candidatus Brocadiales bacterium]